MMAIKLAAAESIETIPVHIVLQGKGGVGKSLISALLGQYFLRSKTNVRCIDTDPVNQTLSNYKALGADHIQLLNGSKIDERNFDQLMEKLLSQDGVFVIDNGASSFIPLSNYLVENNALEMLNDAGRTVIIHSIIAGGPNLIDTISGFVSLAKQTQNVGIVIWLNEFFGPIEKDGKAFTDMKGYVDNQDRVLGIIRLPRRNQDTFGKDFELMNSQKLTFSEVMNGPEFSIMAKQRIKTVQRDIFTQLEQIGL